MQNLSTFQAILFYTCIGIIALQGIVFVLVMNSSIRFYIMFSRKFIFRNIEFINGEIVLIGDQKNDLGVKELLAAQTASTRKEAVTPVQSAREINEQIASPEFVISSEQDLEDYANYTLSESEEKELFQVIVRDLDMDSQIQKETDSKSQKEFIEKQKSNLVEISLENLKIVNEIIIELSNEFVKSFHSQSPGSEISNLLDYDLSNRLTSMGFSEDAILFYRECGRSVITARFEQHLIQVSKLKQELLDEKKKTNSTIPPPELFENLSLDELLARGQDLKRNRRAILKTASNQTYELEFAQSA
jgi:uncharacterized protein YjgD (DUF1641 family)